MLYSRFKEARLAAGYSQEQLAEATQVTQAAIYKIEAGLTANPRKLKVFADALGVGEEWLKYGISDTRNESEYGLSSKSNASKLEIKVGTTATDGLGLDSSSLGEPSQIRFVDVPVYDVSFSAGAGCFFDNAEVIGHHSISIEALNEFKVSPSDASVFKVKGESMESTLHDGDTILVDRSISKPKNNKIFAFSFDGELKVKRFFHQLDRSWKISSDNEDKNRYQDEFVFNERINELDIVGQVLTILNRSLV
jgi:phage repressor protein C with HTH and peptisase S24 domain